MTFYSGQGPLDSLFTKIFIGLFLFYCKVKEWVQECIDGVVEDD